MRGILFSVSILIFGLTLLTLVIVLSTSGIVEQGDVSRQVLFNRLQDEVTYIQRELKSILEIYDFNVSASGNTISITELLPFEKTDKYTTDVNNWKTFVEDKSDFDLTVTVAQITNNLPFIINDQVQYLHTNGLGGTKITVENASIVSNYSVFMNIDADGNISTEWKEQESGSNVLSLFIITHDDSFSGSWSLDFTKGNELEIIIDGSEIEFQVGKGNDHGFLKVDNKNTLPMILTTNITLNTSYIDVSLPKSIINITSDQYNINRVTTSILAKS